MQQRTSRLKTALILAGGGSLGAFEAGALQPILDKIMPDVLIGTSVGSINAAAIAIGKSAEEIEENWNKVDGKNFFPLNKSLFWKFTHAHSFYSRSVMERFIRDFFGKATFSESKIPLYINATELKNGREKFFEKGSIVEAILASTALAPLYPSYRIKGIEYVDGAFSNYVSTDKAVALDCTQIIIVAPDYRGQLEEYNHSLTTLSTHLNHLMQFQMLRKAIELCGDKKVVVVTPNKPLNISPTDFSHTKKLLKLGRKAAERIVEKIIV